MLDGTGFTGLESEMLRAARAILEVGRFTSPPRIERVDATYDDRSDGLEVDVRALCEAQGPGTPAPVLIGWRFMVRRTAVAADLWGGARFNLFREFAEIYYRELEDQHYRAEEQELRDKAIRAHAAGDFGAFAAFQDRMDLLRQAHFMRQRVAHMPSTERRNLVRARDLDRVRRQAQELIERDLFRQFGPDLPSLAAAVIRNQGDYPAAVKRSLELLRANLTEEQRNSLDRHGYFNVVSQSGKAYQICRGRQQNIYLLDRHGRRKKGICFLPQGNLAIGDCMLAQKIALELYEDEALRVAQPFPVWEMNNWR